VTANLNVFQSEISTFSTESADLCLSSMRRVLGKLNANAGSERMQLTGQWECKRVVKWSAIPQWASKM
jgi:hypothetical protein